MSGGFFTSYTGALVMNFGILGIVVVGFYVTFLSGQLSVAHQMFMSAGAYAAGYLSVEYGWTVWQTMPVSIAVGAALGIITGLVTLRLNGIFLSIATLALSESLVVLLNNTKTVGGIFGLSGISLTSTGAMIVGALAIAVIAALLIDMSSFGLQMRAVADDELAAEAAGVRVRLVRVAAFGLGAGIAALGGNLYAHRFGYIEPSAFGLALGLQIILAARLGGRAFIIGPLLGTAVVIWLPEYLRSADIDRDITFGGLLILLVILRPDGLTGTRIAWRRFGARIFRGGSRVAPSTDQHALATESSQR